MRAHTNLKKKNFFFSFTNIYQEYSGY